MADLAHLGSHRADVSILVFVELALDGKRVLEANGRIGVSILVFVELALDARIAGNGPRIHILFQSLFSWNLLLMGSEGAPDATTPKRFNPCFRGTCS